MSDCNFTQRTFKYPPKWKLRRCLAVKSHGWCLVNCCRLGARSVYHTTTHQFTSYFIRSHIRRVHESLAATCACTFGRMTAISLRATAVTTSTTQYMLRFPVPLIQSTVTTHLATRPLIQSTVTTHRPGHQYSQQLPPNDQATSTVNSYNPPTRPLIQSTVTTQRPGH